MATEIGMITGLNHDLATVKTQRATACDGCSEKETCHSMGGGREMEFEAENPIHAQVGDSVVLSFKTGQLLSLSFLLYMFPVISMIVGALAGDHMAPAYSMDPSAAAAISGFMFFVFSFGLIKLLDRHARKNGKYRPVILRIKKKGQPGETAAAGCSNCAPAR